MALTFTKPSETPTLNILLYGAPKSGKTVGAASAPGPILYLNADLPNATRFAHRRHGDSIREAPVQNGQTLTDAMAFVAENHEKIGTVVLDPLGEARRIVLASLASSPGAKPTLPQQGDASTYIEDFCRFMCSAPVNFVIVAHELAIKDEATGEHERVPYTGTNNPALGAKLMGMVDIIGHTTPAPDEDGSATAYVAELGAGRATKGGDRSGVLGASRELDLSEWLETIAADERTDRAAKTKDNEEDTA